MSQHASSHLAEPEGPGVAEGLAPLVATEPSAVESAQKPDSAASREWGSDHPIDIRFTLPALFGRYYLTIVGGKERRSTDRLEEERETLDADTSELHAALAGLAGGDATSLSKVPGIGFQIIRRNMFAQLKRIIASRNQPAILIKNRSIN